MHSQNAYVICKPKFTLKSQLNKAFVIVSIFIDVRSIQWWSKIKISIQGVLALQDFWGGGKFKDDPSNFPKKYIVSSGAEFDFKTAKSCPGFAIYRQVNCTRFMLQ